jgi:nickel-dependent lactate racemase
MKLKYGGGTVSFDAEEMHVLEPNEIPGVKDERKVIAKALHNPIKSKRLSRIAKRGDKVAIIVSDMTRPSPSHSMLPPLLEELRISGVKDDDITIVFALGIHRKQKEEEKRRLVGGEVYGRLRCIDHDLDDCVTVGRKDDTEIAIFKPVSEADIIVCTGNIEFHYFAGYTGGAKAILPGVSSRELIEKNHRMMVLPDAYTGNIKSPVRKQIEEVGEIVGIDFILNVVLNSNKDIVGAFSGHPKDAHRAGVRLVDEMYRVKVERSDIVIVSAGGHPKDINLYQAQKALDNAKHAVKDGGSIILVAECPEGYGESTFERWIDESKSPEDIIDRLKKKFVLGGHKAAVIASVVKKADVYLVSKMPDEMVEKAFLIPKKDVEDALRDARKRGRSILIMPSGSTLPTS